MERKKFVLEMTGVTDLLLHSDNIEWADRVDAHIEERNLSGKAKKKGEKKEKKGDDRFPAWKWIGCLYHDGKTVTIPFEVITKCLTKAAGQFIRQKNTTYQSTMASALWMESDCFPLMVKGVPVSYAPIAKIESEEDYQKHLAVVQSLGFSLFAKRALVNNGKHIRVRPRFSNWSVVVEGDIDTSMIEPELFERICATAGSRFGCGDWRPGGKTPGQFGIFKTSVKWVK